MNPEEFAHVSAVLDVAAKTAGQPGLKYIHAAALDELATINASLSPPVEVSRAHAIPANDTATEATDETGNGRRI